MTPEQLASLSPAERARLMDMLRMQDSGAPEDPNLAAAATPIEPDPEVAAPVRRAPTPYENEQRLRRLARRAGMPAAEARKMLVADAGSDFEKYEMLREAGNDRIDAERDRRQAETAKALHFRAHPMGYALRGDITPDQRDAALAFISGSPGVLAEQIRAKALLESAAAKDRQSSYDRRWLAEHQAGIQRAAQDAAAAAAAAQREFEGPHKDKDREVAAQANSDRMTAELAKFQADLAAQSARNDQAMKALELQITQGDNQHAERMASLGPKDTAATVAQARLADIQAEDLLRKLRAGDEEVLGEKYANSYVLPWWLGGGYDDFTIEEQQQMYEDLLAQNYKEADAMRAVDAQAEKRRATHRMRWAGAGG